MARYYGGGMVNWYHSSPTITNCIFIANTVKGSIVHDVSYGGGMDNWSDSSPTLTNCIFIDNTADIGGGMYNSDHSSPVLTNCILWANSATIEGDEIFNDDYEPDDPSDPNFMYCDIASSGGSTAWDISLGNDDGGNIDTDPMFVRDPNDGGDGWRDISLMDEVDESANNDYGDLRLQPASLCIDTGDNTAVTEPNDFDDRTRIIDGDCDGTATVDMGAYEFNWYYIGDLAGGCDINLQDFAVLAEQWRLEHLSADIAPAPAGDGIVNLLDFASLASRWTSSPEDFIDLTETAEQWLDRGAHSADIAPAPAGDGLVDILDLQVLTKHWLQRTTP
jgi:hypothetical protein